MMPGGQPAWFGVVRWGVPRLQCGNALLLLKACKVLCSTSNERQAQSNSPKGFGCGEVWPN